MRLGLGVIHDRIVDGTRPHHHAYAAAFPWYVPLKDYRGDIRIEDRPNGSLIVWTASCTPRFPGLSGLARNFGDVFGAGSGSERAVGVIVGGDALE